MAAGGAERSRLNVVALVITVAFACSGPPAAEDGAAIASPSAAPPTPPPTETTRPAPIASATIPTTAAFAIRLEPPAPQPGTEFVILISGLRPGEPFELSVARPGEDPSFAPLDADSRGEFRSIVPPGALTVFTVVARRADGASAQLAFGTAALGPLTPTPPGTAGTATPSALQPLRTSGALPAPPTGAPAERTPSPSLGPTPAPFAVTLERVTDAGEIDIVLSGLGPSELVELTIGLPASPDDVYRVNADAGGAFRWRSPVAPGLAFTVVARRATGEMARAAATAAPTPSVPATEPPCVTTGAGDARTGIEGYFALGGRALVGLTVEMREWRGGLTGGLEGCLTCPLHGTGVTDREGRVLVVGLPPGVLIEPVVPDPRYTRHGHLGSFSGGTTVCAGRIVPATTLDARPARAAQEGRLLYWKITGFETSVSAADGTMALRWDAVPDATTYCVRMLDQGPPPHTASSILTPGACMGLVDHATLAAATFRTPPLIAGDRRYDLQIVSFTGANASGIFSGGFTKFE